MPEPTPSISIESPIRNSAWNRPGPVGVRSVSSAPNTFFKKSTYSGPCGSRYGVTVRKPARNTTVFALICVFLSNSVRRPALKTGDGNVRKSRAIRSSSATSASGVSGFASGFARILLIARSNWSINGCLLMTATHARSQAFQRPELKLLDRAFRPAEFLRNISDGFLFDEPFDNNRPLIFGKTLDELKQRRATLDFLPAGQIEIVRGRHFDGVFHLASPVRDSICRNPIQPYGERHTAPFEASDIFQSVMEHLRRQVFRLVPVVYTANDKRVNALKVRFIQFSEAAWILLRGFDQQPFLFHCLYKRPGQAKSHGRRLFAVGSNVGDGGYADPVELPLSDDIAFHQNAMAFKLLRRKASPEVPEIRKPKLAQPQQFRFGGCDFLLCRDIRHRRAHRLRSARDCPGHAPVGHATNGQDEGELRRGLHAVPAEYLHFVQDLGRQFRLDGRKCVCLENVTDDVDINIVGKRFRFRRAKPEGRHFGSDHVEQRFDAVVMPSFHEVVALQRRNFAFTAQICLMAAAAIRRVRLLAAVCLFLGVGAVPYALFCRLGGQT